jgi:O-antigen/teichoic acid export membrane protein
LGTGEKKLASGLPAFAQLWERLQGKGVGAVLARGASGAFAVNAAGTGLAFLAQLALARFMGAKGYGDYTLAFTWMGFVLLACKLGFDTASLRFVAEYRGLQQWGLLRGYLRRSSQIVLAASLVSAAGMAGVVWVMKGQEESAWVFWLACAILPLNGLLLLQGAALRGLKSVFNALLPQRVVRPALVAGGVVLFYFLGGKKLVPAEAMAITLGAFILAVVYSSVFLRRYMPSDSRGVAPEYRTGFWFRTALPMLLIGALMQMENQVDIIVLGYFMDNAQVGIYAAARKLTVLIPFMLTAVNFIAAPMISELYAQGKREELKRMVRLAAQGIFAFTLPVCLLMVVLGRHLLSVFGAEFVAGYPALLILTGGQLVNALSGSVGFFMIMTGHQREASIIIGSAALLNILFNASLVPHFGITGAAAATAGTTMLWNASMVVYVWKRLRVNPTILPVPVRG